jgi:hypothetical protein
MKIALRLTFLFVVLFGISRAPAQTFWNDSAGDSSWSDSSNWSNGVPGVNSSVVQIGSMQAGDSIVGIDTGNNVSVASFTFNNSASLSGGVQILNDGSGEQLTLNGAITNLSAGLDTFGVIVNAGANATYAGGSGGLEFDLLNVNTQTIGTSGSVVIGSGGTLVFDINSVSAYGSIGSVNASGADIDILGTYTGHAGDSFDLTTGNFQGATIVGLPTLSAGLTWNTTNFNSNGVLTVQSAVPEPSTYALVGVGFLVLLLLGRIKRKATPKAA